MSPTERRDTTVLVVGGGGAGLSIAIFLRDLGIDALLIERHPSTSHLPKAHYINQRSMEIFRQHDVADKVYAQAAPRENLGKVYWLTSLGGDGPLDGIVYHEQDIMGAGNLKAQYDAKGSTHPTNIPQIRLEPILAGVAEERNPGSVLFRHELTSLVEDADGVTARVRDLDGARDLEIRADYVIGADAGKTVGPALGISMVPGASGAMTMATVWLTADLSKYVKETDSVIRFIFHPTKPYRMGGLLTYGPEHWDGKSEEWGTSFSIDPSIDDEAILAEALDYLNVDVPISVNLISRWTLDIEIADRFFTARTLIIGDAAHKHPPGSGLGLNSGIQDAHNVAWKLALVCKGLAPRSLLSSYEAERRPVVTRNTDWGLLTMSNYFLLMTAMGVSPAAPPEVNEAQFTQLLADTPQGATRRALMREVFGIQRMEYSAHDMEMGFSYDTGAVVDDGSTPIEHDPMGADYRPNSRPGSRVPHAWLEHGGSKVSTHDLIPMGGFLLIAGERGDDWANAAEKVATETGVVIRAVRIGERGDARDPSGAWAEVRGIDDDGALLVRPDGHVGFRSASSAANPYETLRGAIDSLIGTAA
jgi:2,4-dichlorophenol 6-monooxygenase